MEGYNRDNENHCKVFKNIFIMNKCLLNKITFDAFLVNTQTIPYLIEFIENSSIFKDENNNNDLNEESLLKDYLNNNILEEIKLFYSFEECQYIIKQNLEDKNTFIIVDKHFIKYFIKNNNNINNKKVKIIIDKINSNNSIKFPKSNKILYFTSIKPGIYKFIKINKNEIESNIIINNYYSLENIKSKNIIYKIISYIKDKDYLLKLIKYSKRYQKKIGVKLINYKEKWVNNRLNYEDYLLETDETKQKLFEELKEYLLYNNIEIKNINTFILNYFKNYLNNLGNKDYSLFENSKNIDINSPFFDILITSEFFNKIFNIMISFNIDLEKSEKQNEYKLKFEELNKSKYEYSSITFRTYCKYHLYNEKILKKFEYILNNLNINFKNIKKLSIPECINVRDSFSCLTKEIKVLNFIDIPHNLIYFEYGLPFYENEKNKFINLNELKSLKYLYLSNIEFYPEFYLKLKNLKNLKLIRIYGIYLDYCELERLKYLELELDEFENKLFKFPELNTLLLHNNSEYDSIIDFNSLKKLKIFKGSSENFLLLENSANLEKLILDDIYEENLIFEKIISLNHLQEIELNFRNYSKIQFDCFNEIKNKNYTVKKLIISFDDIIEINIIGLQNFFWNLTELIIIKPTFEKYRRRCVYNRNFGPYKLKEKCIIIAQNENSKIDNLKLYLPIGYIYNHQDFKLILNSAPFDKIKYFDLTSDSPKLDKIPFFQEKCYDIFASLLSFKFSLYIKNNYIFQRKYNLIKNFDNNIDKMPNLREFIFTYNCEDITEDFFIKFIEKVLNLKCLKNVEININGKDSIYSKDELIKMFPKINIDKFYAIKIHIFCDKAEIIKAKF